MDDFNINKAIGLWFFIIALSTFVVLGSVAVHEIGHALVGAAAGCKVQHITLYAPGANPTTAIECNNTFNHVLVSLAGMGLNILFGIFFLFTNKKIMNNIAYMFFGFGLFSAKLDLQSIGFSSFFGSLISLLGIGFMIYALYLLCSMETNELFTTKQVVATWLKRKKRY